MTARDVYRYARTPITLIVLLVVLGYGALWGYRRVVAPFVAKPPPPCVTQQAQQLTPGQVTVKILNGGDERGFATNVAKVLRARGFNVVAVGNTDDKVTKTTIVGAAAENPEVKLVAGQFSDSVIRVDGRPDHSVDVVLGKNNGDAVPGAGYPTVIPLPGGTVCLPSPTASATPR